MHKLYACLLLCFALSAHADIYRCADSDGQIRFTDHASDCEIARRVILEAMPEATCEDPRNCASPAANAQPAGLAADLSSDISPRLSADLSAKRPSNLPSKLSSNLSSNLSFNLSTIFVPLRELGPEWSLVDDAPEPIDLELRNHGLRDTLTRHYSRSTGRVSQVCSVELWQFAQAGSASAAARSLDLPHWQVLRAGSVLVLTHGVRLELGAGSNARLHEACAELGMLTYDRISLRP